MFVNVKSVFKFQHLNNGKCQQLLDVEILLLSQRPGATVE